MPPIPKTKLQVKQEKSIIINNSLKIISEKGISNLTMREVAKLCNSTTSKLYYYFESKEHLILSITSCGFNALQECILNNISNTKNPTEKLNVTLKSIYNFGIESSIYFNLMFSSEIPKYYNTTEDCKFFDAITEHNQIGLSFYNLYTSIVYEYANSINCNVDDNYILTIFIRIYGIIGLNNAGMLKEVNAVADELLESTLKSIINDFKFIATK